MKREPYDAYRRRYLKHDDDCPMRHGPQFDCNCHYTDCLDYSWHKTGKIRGCVCEQLDNPYRPTWFDKLLTKLGLL